ncbi:MAG: DUF3422 domain-containing protein [Paracoccaceae bacterium]|jgi:uncharacterized membrane-anchored protein
MQHLKDHSRRYALSNELHARPFPPMEVGQSALIFAVKPERHAARRDKSIDFQHLIALLDRLGAAHPQPNATHFSADVGPFFLKWECHTEFTTYTVIMRTPEGRAFDPTGFDVFPKEWLDEMPGVCVTSAIVRCEEMPNSETIKQRLTEWFVPESLAVSYVLDRAAVVASDLRVDTAGFTRFVLFADVGTGTRRLGRIMQRLFEIEVYKSMSMLGLARASGLSRDMGPIDARLTTLTKDMAQDDVPHEQTLHALLEISGELEQLTAATEFRFGATAAYQAIVNTRIEVLREERFEGRQTFHEFMMRRYDPSMRTIQSTEGRLRRMLERAIRAGDLLRTRVDVARSKQNQDLLTSMNERADTQLRLQRTVEGLSVVAISYYAVSLVAYGLYPLAEVLDLSKGWLMALITPLVVGTVWWLVSRIRAKFH